MPDLLSHVSASRGDTGCDQGELVEKIWRKERFFLLAPALKVQGFQAQEGAFEGVDNMSMTDPIADMLTRLRNANRALHDKVDMPSSKLKLEIAKIMKEEGFLKNFRLIDDKKQGILRIYMKYGPGDKRILMNLARVSRPGLRVYVTRKRMAKSKKVLGISILSTSKGVMTDKRAEEVGVGGEVICYIQ